MPAFVSSWFVFIRLLGRHFKRNKKLCTKCFNRGKLKTHKNKENSYPVKTEFLQNDLCYIMQEIAKNKPPTIRMS